MPAFGWLVLLYVLRKRKKAKIPIKLAMKIMAHSDIVGMGAASVAISITGPNGSVINPDAEFESPAPPSTIE